MKRLIALAIIAASVWVLAPLTASAHGGDERIAEEGCRMVLGNYVDGWDVCVFPEWGVSQSDNINCRWALGRLHGHGSAALRNRSCGGNFINLSLDDGKMGFGLVGVEDDDGEVEAAAGYKCNKVLVLNDPWNPGTGFLRTWCNDIAPFCRQRAVVTVHVEYNKSTNTDDQVHTFRGPWREVNGQISHVDWLAAYDVYPYVSVTRTRVKVEC